MPNNGEKEKTTPQRDKNNGLLLEFYGIWLKRMTEAVKAEEDIKGIAAAGESVRKYDEFMGEKRRETDEPDPVSAAIQRWAENNG